MHTEDPENESPGDERDVALARDLAAAVGIVFESLRLATRRNLTAEPLSSSEVDLLRLTGERPGIRMGDAADALALAPNTLTTLVARSCEAGYLRRERATDDRRVIHLTLSEAGASRLASWRDLRAETLSAALAHLPESDRAALAAALPPFGHLVARLRGD